MQKIIIGSLIGIVIGVLFGASVVAPRLTGEHAERLVGSEQSGDDQASTTPDNQTEQMAQQVTGASAAPQTLAIPVNLTATTDMPNTPDGNRVHWNMAGAYTSSLPLFGTLGARLEREIFAISHGDITIRFHEPNTLAPAHELFNAVSSGAIDAAFTTPALSAEHIPALGLFGSSPFGPSSGELLAWLYAGDGRERLNDVHHVRNLHAEPCGMVAAAPAGWFRREINSVADLNGLRMHIDGLGARAAEKLGVQPVWLNQDDISAALSRGDIDAAEFSLPSVDQQLGLHKAAKNYYFPGWHQRATLLVLLVRLETWQALPTLQRTRLMAVCGDNVRQGLAEGEAMQFEALKKITAAGTTVARLPDDVLSALSDAWHTVASEQAADNKEFAQVWSSLSAFRRDYDIWNELSAM